MGGTLFLSFLFFKMTEELTIKKTSEGKIKSFKAIRKATAVGDGSHVMIPKELEGEYIKIEWVKLE